MVAASAPSRLWQILGWFPEFLAFRRRSLRLQGRLLAAALAVGVVAGLGAIVFTVACQAVVWVALDAGAGYRPLGPGNEARVAWLPETDQAFRPWLLLLIPVLGGLVSGWLVFTFAPEAEGHGTDSVIDAYHRHQGQIRPRVPLIKILASAITLGSGGSGGREGPIAQIGAGFGSFLANLIGLPPAQRRVLLAAGMGAGIAAVFRAPLAGALFAAEVLYSSPEFEPEVIIPAGVASVVAYCTFGLAFGYRPLFSGLPRLEFDDPLQLVPYLVLALAMAFLAMLYTRSFYGLQRLFHRLPLPRTLKPALGAFLTGGFGLALFALFQRKQALAVMSFGYGILQDVLTEPSGLPADTWTAVGLLLGVALGKILTTSLTIGSGGSGGVFGPSMVIGGCAGGALGLLFHSLWPGLVPHPVSFALVGMAGFFSAAAKTPFSTLIIVSEMTGDYGLLLPTLWVCLIGFLLSDEQSLYHSQVLGRSQSPAHQGRFVSEAVAGALVGPLMRPAAEVPVIHPGDPLDAVLQRLADSPFPVLPVLDGDGKLLGVVDLEEAQLAAQAPHARPLLLAADLMRARVPVLHAADRIDQALELFVEADLLALPVVDQDNRHFVGLVRRRELSTAFLRRVQGTPDRPAPAVPRT
jgi:CIC family chloride channel protein